MPFVRGEAIVIQGNEVRKVILTEDGLVDCELEVGTSPEETSELLSESVLALQQVANQAGLVLRVDTPSEGPAICGCDCARFARRGGDTYEERGLARVPVDSDTLSI